MTRLLLELFFNIYGLAFKKRFWGVPRPRVFLNLSQFNSLDYTSKIEIANSIEYRNLKLKND